MSNLHNSNRLKGKKIAILATDGFEQSELLSPQAALLEAGADIEVVSIKEGQIILKIIKSFQIKNRLKFFQR